MATKRYDKRRWLNPKRSNNSGALQWGAAVDDGYLGHYCLDMDMSIWDCSRKVTLDFGFGTETERRVVLTKLDIMQEALDDLKWTALHVDLNEN